MVSDLIDIPVELWMFVILENKFTNLLNGELTKKKFKKKTVVIPNLYGIRKYILDILP